MRSSTATRNADALEMRRQMQEKAKQKAEIFGKEKKGPVK